MSSGDSSAQLPDVGAPQSGTIDVNHSRGVLIGEYGTQINFDVNASALPPTQVPSNPVLPGAVHNLPSASGVFVGRDLEAVDHLFMEHPVVAKDAMVGQVAVHGLGGVGKTELVIQYARVQLSRCGLAWWITADTAQNVELGLAALARRLYPMAALIDAEAWAVGWLQSHSRWLLILDNVEDPGDIMPLFGQVMGNGRIMITTRRDLGVARWARLGLVPMNVDVLERADSIQLLTRLADQNDPIGADRLAAELGDLPLALEQAAAYIGQHAGLTFDGYRLLLADSFTHVSTAAGEGSEARRTIARVWQVTIDAISARSGTATQILGVLAWLAPDSIPADILTPLVDEPLNLDEALSLLASYSMISRSDTLISLHRLVQAVIRSRDDTASNSSPAVLAIRILRNALPNEPSRNFAAWSRWELLLPHVEALVTNLPPTYTNVDLLDICHAAATYQRRHQRLSGAVRLLEKAVAGRLRIQGDVHPSTLSSQHELALTYLSAERVDEAVRLAEYVLRQRRHLLGSHHPETLISRALIGHVYHLAGRTDDAISANEEFLTDSDNDLESGLAFEVRNNQAGALVEAGRIGEAIPLYHAVLANRRLALGEHHPDVFRYRQNLACAYAQGGRADEAVALLEQLVDEHDQLLGATHPDTLFCRECLAWAYRMSNRIESAISLLDRVLVDCRNSLGPNHPRTQAIGEKARDARLPASQAALLAIPRGSVA